MKKVLIALAVLAIASIGYADLVATWDFDGFAGGEASAAGTMLGNMDGSTLTRGAGLNTAGNGNRFNAVSFSTADGGSLANALTVGDYFTFSLDASTSYAFSLDSLVINVQSSGSGPQSWALFSSVDGFAAAGDALNDWSAVGNSTQTATLSGVTGLQDVEGSIEFRVYGYGATSSSGSGGFEGAGNDITVNGTATVQSRQSPSRPP